MMPYVPGNWYWVVGADSTRVFSSAGAACVPVTDAAYLAWIAAGNGPSKIETEDALWEVLSLAYPAGIPPDNTTAQDKLKSIRITGMDQVAMKIAFNHENRIRALEGKQAVTAAQFIAAIKALL